ncbi:MAG: hypothetical protein LBN29_09605, partial [Mediterranea sp.]|nr:hypothetical protein [Mediterranea sp.]
VADPLEAYLGAAADHTRPGLQPDGQPPRAGGQGGFINGPATLKADPNNSLFQHEYGHYLQSQAMGWAYLSRVGIPSFISASKEDDMHDFSATEQDANRRAFTYFNENVPGFYQTADDYADLCTTKRNGV